MAQTYPLDTIIKKVDKRTLPSTSTEARVIVDRRSGETKDKSALFDSVDYFLISTGNTVKYSCSPVRIEDETGRYIDILPTFRVSCIPDQQKKVAQALYGEIHPGKALDRYVSDWLNNKAAGAGETGFIDTFFDRREELKSSLADDCRAQVGLALRALDLRLDGEDTLTTLPVELSDLAVRMFDFSERRNIRVVGELRVDENDKINAIAKRGLRSKLNDLIREETKEFFSNNVGLERLYSDLGQLRDELKKHLNLKLKSSGRQIGNLFLKCDLDEIPPFFKTVVPVALEVPEYPEEVKIVSTIQMERRDAATFITSQPSITTGWSPQDIERILSEWASLNITQAVSSVFFGKKYVDLLLEKEELEMDIKSELSLKAAEIGYGIRQLMTIPDLEPIRWLEKIEFEIDDEFTTKSSRKVKLKVVVKAKLNSLRDVHYYLDRRQSVPFSMRVECESGIRQFIHSIDSERFHMRFDYSGAADEKSVRDEVIELVGNTLQKKYTADVISVMPEMGETEITARPPILSSQWHPFASDITSRPDLGRVVITGRFRITGIDAAGWSTFEGQTFDIADVKQHIEETIKSSLSTAALEDVAFTDHQTKLELMQVLNKICTDSVRDAYGLQVLLMNIDRDGTDIETLLGNKLQELKMRLILAKASGEDLDEVQDLERRINELENHRYQKQVDFGARSTLRELTEGSK